MEEYTDILAKMEKHFEALREINKERFNDSDTE